jgi:hypothetical protein
MSMHRAVEASLTMTAAGRECGAHWLLWRAVCQVLQSSPAAGRVPAVAASHATAGVGGAKP